MQIEQAKELRSLNTFAVPARARGYAGILDAADVAAARDWAARHHLPMLVLGGGSNVLFLDDFDGLILHPLAAGRQQLGNDKGRVAVRAGAGESWHQLVMWCLKENLYGIENLALIPGSVGAAPIQNIGAYGVELKDWFHSLDAWDLQEDRLVTLDQEACRFGYRDSFFKQAGRDRYVILAVTLALSREPDGNISYPGLQEELGLSAGAGPVSPAAIAAAVCRLRLRKLPDPAVLPNAGSFFKNPIVSEEYYRNLSERFPGLPGYPDAAGTIKLPAAWLLEQAGCKGLRDGQVGTHAHQPLVIVNYGGANGRQIHAFSQRLQARIEEVFGLVLEPEVRLIG